MFVYIVDSTADRPLYVGCTIAGVAHRIQQHYSKSKWITEVTKRTMLDAIWIEGDNYGELGSAEHWYIATLCPKYNVVGNTTDGPSKMFLEHWANKFIAAPRIQTLPPLERGTLKGIGLSGAMRRIQEEMPD